MVGQQQCIGQIINLNTNKLRKMYGNTLQIKLNHMSQIIETQSTAREEKAVIAE
jgi:hypothetical protein